jgi:hypothetical protein
MAGAHITEATPPTKMRLRVSIEPPNINVSEITLQLSEGKCPITTECLYLEPEELELVAHRARPGYPGLGRELTKRRRDRDKPLSVWPCVASWISSGKPYEKPQSCEQQSLQALRQLSISLAARWAALLFRPKCCLTHRGI